jgi:hypothetical protein
MDQLLHRGIYAVEPEGDSDVLIPQKNSLLNRILGIDDQFSRSDRWITLGIFWWSITWFIVFVFGSVAYLIHPWSSEIWANFWFVQAICMPLAIGVVTTVWFTIGCFHDLRVFFRRLREEKVDVNDDGVVEHEKE